MNVIEAVSVLRGIGLAGEGMVTIPQRSIVDVRLLMGRLLI